MRGGSRERGFVPQFVSKASGMIDSACGTYPLNSGLKTGTPVLPLLDMVDSLPSARSDLSLAKFEASTRAFSRLVRGARRRPW